MAAAPLLCLILSLLGAHLFPRRTTAARPRPDSPRGGGGVAPLAAYQRPPPGLELAGAPELGASELLAFERDGHCATRGLLAPAEAALLLESLRAEHGRRQAETVGKLLADHGPNRRRGDVPFEQLFNLWAYCAAARAVAGSERLAATAAALLGCERVRLYQDTLLLKRRGHGPTHWHSDLHMAPLDTNSFVTCWIALTPVPRRSEGGSSLTFASGSHRDCAHLFWADEPTAPVERSRYRLRSHAPHAPGDATWHHGWILHTAPPNGAQADRWAFAVTFFADGARTLNARQRAKMNGEDSPSYRPWLAELDRKGAGEGTPAEHERLPLVPWGAAREPRLAGEAPRGAAQRRRAPRAPESPPTAAGVLCAPQAPAAAQAPSRAHRVGSVARRRTGA